MTTGLFGGSAPAAPQQGPRWWDTLLGVTMKGMTPMETRAAWEDRQLARAQAVQSAELRSRMFNEIFPSGSPQTGPIVAPTSRQYDAADQLLGVDPARQAQLSGGNAPARGGAPAGNLFRNPDGSLRSALDLNSDPRWVAAQMDPSLAATFAPWMAAAEARAPEYVFQNDQFFNVNSNDPSLTGRRVGTGVNNETGMYTEVGPNGQVISRQSEGFNEMNASAREAAAIGTGRGQNATLRDQNAINLPYEAELARLRQQAEWEARAAYEPGVQGAIAAAEARETAPYTFQTIQGRDGPITGTVAQMASAQGPLANGPVQGRDAGAINAANEADSAARAEINSFRATNDRLGHYYGLLERDEMNLGPMTNLSNRARNFMGEDWSNRDSVNYQMFTDNIQGLVNESLRLNTGTQTDADARRVANELLSNMTNEAYVMQRLAQLRGYNERAIREREAAIARRNPSGAAQAAPAQGGSPAARAAAALARRQGRN